jgi:hypothetical protein
VAAELLRGLSGAQLEPQLAQLCSPQASAGELQLGRGHGRRTARNTVTRAHALISSKDDAERSAP